MNEKEQLWYARYLEYIDSGLPQQRWCRQHGLPQSSFRYWCNKFEVFQAKGMAMPVREDLPDFDAFSPQEQVEAADRFYEIVCVEDPPAGNPDCPDVIRIRQEELVMEFPASMDPSGILMIAKGLFDYESGV